MNKYIMIMLCGVLSFSFLIFYILIGDGNGIFNSYEKIGLLGCLFSLILMLLYGFLENDTRGGLSE